MISVTLILPTYNEVENIGNILNQVMNWQCNIIVVDDGSLDGTIELVRTRFESIEDSSKQFQLLVRKYERGLGSAIRAGTKIARTPWIAVMDSDGQHSPKDVFTLLSYTENTLADIYIGSRLRSGGNMLGLPWWRKFATKILNSLGSIRAQSKATDYLTGMFVVHRSHILTTKENGFKILYEILKQNKLKVVEIPITLYPRKGGKSKANIREIIRYLKLVFS